MSWIDIAWPMMGAASLTLGVIHLLIWFRQHGQRAHLIFSLAAGAVSVLAIIELLTMRAQEPAHYATLLRWGHVAVAVMVVSLVGFVLLHFQTGRPWLGITVCVLRAGSVVANFTTGASLNFETITSLDQVEIWGGDVVSVPVGTPNPWMLLAQASNVLMMLFFADALATVWRRGDSDERRRALIVCGSMALFIALASLWAASVVLGWLAMPLTVNVAFLIVIMAMSYELGSDVIRSALLDRQLVDRERDLLESEQRMQLAVHAAGLGLWTWDLESNASWFSETGNALLGFSPDQHISRDVLMAKVHPEDRKGVLQALDEAAHRAGEYNCEYRMPQADGRMRWIAVEGRVEYSSKGAPRVMRGVILDITERRQGEERFRLVIECAPIAMLLLDGDGRITLANAQAERLFGYSNAELLTECIDTLVPDARAESAGDGIEPATEYHTSGKPAGMQLFAKFRDGGMGRVEVRFAPVPIAGDRFVLASIIDISDRVRLEQESDLQREELAHLSRVTLLGEMTGSIAHELNQPLTAVLSNAQAALRFLARDPPDMHELHDCLVDIVENDKRASEVIRRLRAMLRKEKEASQVLAVNEVVRDVLRLAASDILNRNVTVSVDLGRELPMIEGDRVQLQQVLLNLVINACDAMKELNEDRALTVRTQQVAGPAVQVTVSDVGQGIDPDDLERIFSPFVTTKLEGVGLGLSICRTIIQSHGGTIFATNNDEGGAALHFQLPAISLAANRP